LDVINDEGSNFKFDENYATIINNIRDNNGNFIKDKVLEYTKDKKIALTIKGIQWSNFDSYLRDQIRDMFLNILLTSDAQKCIN
jgi:hypothetical protein